MAVIYNNANAPADVTLADTSVTDWVIIANGESAGLDSLGEVTGSTFTVPAYSAIVAVDKASYESTGILQTVKLRLTMFMKEQVKNLRIL